MLIISTANADENLNISSTLMRSTFKIQEGKNVGTVFILSHPLESDPTRSYYVLFTAAHVLNSMKNDFATIYLRKKNNDNFIKFGNVPI